MKIELLIFVFLQKHKMDLQSRKISFVQEFLRLQDEGIISGLEELMRKKKAELYSKELSPKSYKEFNDEIDQAMEDSENQRITKAKDLKQKVKKWD